MRRSVRQSLIALSHSSCVPAAHGALPPSQGKCIVRQEGGGICCSRGWYRKSWAATERASIADPKSASNRIERIANVIVGVLQLRAWSREVGLLLPGWA